MKTIPFILSLAHRDRIEKLCSRLNQINMQYFVCYVVFNNGQTFVLSNMFHMLAAYYIDNLYQEDYSFKKETTIDVTHYLCNKTASVSRNFADVLENKFNIYRAYYIIRNCPECQFIFGAIKNEKFDNFDYIYRKTLNTFEEFCCYFVDSTIDIIKQYNPTYASSIILNDKQYRHSIIKSDSTENEKLTAREIDCLHWSAYGKSSEETAKILGICKPTVDYYRNEAKRKLCSVNMAQAVFEGVIRGYIGGFSNHWKRMDTVSINGLSIASSMQEAKKTIQTNSLWLLNNQLK